MTNSAQSRLYDNLQDVPSRKAGLLLGTSRYSRGGGPNRFFWNRIDAAVELYEAGLIEYIIASGDNRFVSYNEPASMKDALLDRGVDEEAIILDHAGFSTLDSVVRSRLVYGQDRIVIISQRFHNQRALFVADNNGIDAVAYNAESVPFSDSFGVYIREFLARAKAVMDVYVLRREPRIIGEQRPIE
ncbi:MAG: vancomycin high temperature exclusion protein [Spirochaetales bacterium]